MFYFIYNIFHLQNFCINTVNMNLKRILARLYVSSDLRMNHPMKFLVQFRTLTNWLRCAYFFFHKYIYVADNDGEYDDYDR